MSNDSINTNTWTEATDGLTNNERGVLWALLRKSAPYTWGEATEWTYPAVQRTTSTHDDVKGYRHGTNVTDAGQIGKALRGLEDKGYISTSPRSGVKAEYTRHYNMNAPIRFRYRADEYRRWQQDPKGYHSLKWYEVMHVTVPLADALREAIVREKASLVSAADNAEYENAKRRLDNEPQRLAEFVALLDEYRAKFGDGSLPVEEQEYYDGTTRIMVTDLLGKIEREAKGLRSWIYYYRDDDVETVAARESEAVAA